MIHDLDHSIDAFLKGEAPPGSLLAAATISFALPDEDWRDGLPLGMTVNCYLYDIREDMAQRRTGLEIVRAVDGTAARVPPPVQIECSYCLSAWNGATDGDTPESERTITEHQLLGELLGVLLRYPTIPTTYLRGQLATQIPPYPALVAQPDATKNRPEFWQALNQQLKPSLNYTLTLGIRAEVPVYGAVVSSEDTINMDLDQLVR